MSEIPVIRFNVGDEKVECTPENASLFRHLGQYAMYDHVFLVDEEQEDRRTGTILFLRPMLDDDKVDEVTDFMLAGGYECHVHIRQPAKSDKEAFNTMIENRAAEIPDEFPDDWN